MYLLYQEQQWNTSTNLKYKLLIYFNYLVNVQISNIPSFSQKIINTLRTDNIYVYFKTLKTISYINIKFKKLLVSNKTIKDSITIIFLNLTQII